MELEDLKIISELIHKYGIKAFEEVAKTHSLFLDYMESNGLDNYPSFLKKRQFKCLLKIL